MLLSVRKLLLASVAFEVLPKYCLANIHRQSIEAMAKTGDTRTNITLVRAFHWYVVICVFRVYVYLLHATMDFMLIQFDDNLQTGEWAYSICMCMGGWE